MRFSLAQSIKKKKPQDDVGSWKSRSTAEVYVSLPEPHTTLNAAPPSKIYLDKHSNKEGEGIVAKAGPRNGKKNQVTVT